MLGNQYIQPDYLGPLPSSLDTKQSPLALLAFTCSQIGSDPPTTPTAAIKKKSCGSSSESSLKSEPEIYRPKSNTTTTTTNICSSGNKKINNVKPPSSPPFSPNLSSQQATPIAAFRPYESTFSTNNNFSGDNKKCVVDLKSVSPKIKPVSTNSAEISSDTKSCTKTKRQNSNNKHKKSPPPLSPTPPLPQLESESKLVSQEEEKNKDEENLVSPIIRSGLEVLQGNDYRKLISSAYAYPFDNHHQHPAFSLPFLTPPPPPPPTTHHHNHHKNGVLGSPYIGYSRVKTASGSESIVQVCKDPYCNCTNNNTSGGSVSALMAAAAGGGFHGLNSLYYPTTGSIPSFNPPPPPSLLSHAAHSLLTNYPHLQQNNNNRPYICNWIVTGGGYCGKQFVSSEELLQHLKIHTTNNLSTTSADPVTLAAIIQQHQLSTLSSNSLYSTTATSSFNNISSSTPPLSPSSIRYHPYSSGISNNKFSLAQQQQALVNFYSSPYNLFNQKVGQN